MVTQEMIDRVHRAAYRTPSPEGEEHDRADVRATLEMLMSFRDDGCGRQEAAANVLNSPCVLDVEGMGEAFSASKRRLIDAALDEVWPPEPTPMRREIPGGFIDAIRKDAYPIAAPEGEEYERARVHQMMEAVCEFRRSKGSMPADVVAAKEEARRVFEAVFRSAF